jgi:hypothetical protein
MVCRDFENIAGELGSDRLTDVRARESALRHAAQCAPCAARLRAERALEPGFRALAADDEQAQAPARLKFALRAAFDRHAELAAEPFPAIEPSRSRNRWASGWSALNTFQWVRWGLAAATLILVALALTAVFRHRVPGSGDLTAGTASTPAPMERSTTPGTDLPKADLPKTHLREQNQNVLAGSNGNKIRRHQNNRAPRRVIDSGDIAANNETVTDFIPLTFLADATAVDSGVVVRVELSRSALLAMGLPVDVERTESRVKADMIVGDDGVARAVRFVR